MSDFLYIYRHIGVAIFCVVFVLGSLLQFIVERRFLLEPYSSAWAIVTDAEPHNHGKLYYDYTVGDNTFSGVGSGSLLPGAWMTVFYIRTDPAVSTDHNPSSGFAGLFGASFVGAVFMSAGMSFAACLVGRSVVANRAPPGSPRPAA